MKPGVHIFTTFFLAGSLFAQKTPPAAYTPWELQNSTTKAGLRGIHAVGNGVAWASGANGTILRTEDGGYMWQSCAMPPGADKLDFRGIWAWDANTAVVMSSGPGDLSRLYKTTDGCSSWKLLYANPDKDGFWDAVQFDSRNHGYLLGDPVNGQFVVLATFDGGGAWRPLYEGLELDSAYPGEGAFAASNSSLTLPLSWSSSYPGRRRGDTLGRPRGTPALFFGTGGAKGSRIQVLLARGLASGLDGLRWESVKLPLASGTDSSGVFSLAFRDQNVGIAVGGDYKKPNESNGTAAYTSDEGKTWTAAAKPPHGYRSAVAWDAPDKAWIAVGTNGSDVSYDDGKTWQPLDNGNWNALSLPWVVGPEGRIAKLVSLKSAGISGK
jgi:photosystem II stability/assembly factor-like uncharacterized protein